MQKIVLPMPIEMGTDKIKKLQRLRERGTISAEEYLRLVGKFVTHPDDSATSIEESEEFTKNVNPDH